MITHVLLMYPTLGEKNGVAERRNRTLMDMVRSMMSYSNLPLGLWMEALETAIHILNRVPSKSEGCPPYNTSGCGGALLRPKCLIQTLQS